MTELAAVSACATFASAGVIGRERIRGVSHVDNTQALNHFHTHSTRLYRESIFLRKAQTLNLGETAKAPTSHESSGTSDGGGGWSQIFKYDKNIFFVKKLIHQRPHYFCIYGFLPPPAYPVLAQARLRHRSQTLT